MLNSIPKNNLADESASPIFLAQLSSDGAPVKLVKTVSDVQANKADLTVFFAIGMIVNIVMIVSFFIWAVKQWKKNDTSKK